MEPCEHWTQRGGNKTTKNKHVSSLMRSHPNDKNSHRCLEIWNAWNAIFSHPKWPIYWGPIPLRQLHISPSLIAALSQLSEVQELPAPPPPGIPGLGWSGMGRNFHPFHPWHHGHPSPPNFGGFWGKPEGFWSKHHRLQESRIPKPIPSMLRCSFLETLIWRKFVSQCKCALALYTYIIIYIYIFKWYNDDSSGTQHTHYSSTNREDTLGEALQFSSAHVCMSSHPFCSAENASFYCFQDHFLC